MFDDNLIELSEIYAFSNASDNAIVSLWSWESAFWFLTLHGELFYAPHTNKPTALRASLTVVYNFNASAIVASIIQHQFIDSTMAIGVSPQQQSGNQEMAQVIYFNNNGNVTEARKQ